MTSSPAKFREAALALRRLGVAVERRAVAMVEPQHDSPRDVVLAKAGQAWRALRRPVLVDDTALVVAGTRGFPGTCTSAVGRTLGAADLRRLVGPGRRAAFTSYVCYHDGHEPRIFTGTWRGTLRPVRRIARAAGLWNASFVPDGCSAPLARVPLEERARRSHRARALSRLVLWLRSRGAPC